MYVSVRDKHYQGDLMMVNYELHVCVCILIVFIKNVSYSNFKPKILSRNISCSVTVPNLVNLSVGMISPGI